MKMDKKEIQKKVDKLVDEYNKISNAIVKLNKRKIAISANVKLLKEILNEDNKPSTTKKKEK